MSAARVVGNVLAHLTVLLMWAFVALYHLSSPWTRTEAGRNIMSLMSALAAVLTLAIVRTYTYSGAGDVAWFAWLRTAVFAAIPVVIGWRTWMLWRVQFRGRRWAEIRGRRRRGQSDNPPRQEVGIAPPEHTDDNRR